MAHGLFLTATYQRVDGFQCEACGIIALGINGHVQIGHRDVLVYLVFTVHVDDLAQNAHCAAHVLGLLRGALHGHTDHDLCTHLTGDIHGVVVLQTTVDQHLIADSHGREGCGNGHRGTHGLWQLSAVEVHFFIGDDVRCHTGKGNRQLVEVERIGKTHT